MRDIKFRAWDYESREMTDFQGGPFYITDIPVAWDEFYFMQYTGLKDATDWGQLTEKERNQWLKDGNKQEDWKGHDIFEGDILKRVVTVVVYGSGKPPEDVVEYLKVEYREDYAGFFVGERPLFAYVDNTHDVDTGCRCTKPVVVGNIFENPEFLKGGDAK